MDHANNSSISPAGTARLSVVVPVALLSFLYVSMLEYALPLYFDARTEAAKAGGSSFPLDVWSEVVKFKVTTWIIVPLLAGLLARRYGERAVWSVGLLGKVPIPLLLTFHPHPDFIAVLAVWQGVTGALIWIAGVSLIQMVAPGKKGLSNGLLMASLGAGSLLGPLTGRVLLYRGELVPLAQSNHWSELWLRLLNFKNVSSTPQVEDFELMFWLLTATTLICGLLMALWGQRPGRFERDEPSGWRQTLTDLGNLSRNRKFWALVLALCFIGGPIFQSSNQFLPYRAKEIGLITAGGGDHGWIWLQLLKTLMWIPGGAAVGLLAGRRAPGIAAVVILGAFSLSALGIGESQVTWQFFCCVAAFEFVRQFMRWSHAGYMSEHMQANLRATAIGYVITFSGLGSTIYVWIMPWIWDPDTADFDASWPFLTAAVVGLVGTAGLFVYDWKCPIRENVDPPTESVAWEKA